MLEVHFEIIREQLFGMMGKLTEAGEVTNFQEPIAMVNSVAVIRENIPCKERMEITAFRVPTLEAGEQNRSAVITGNVLGRIRTVKQ